MRNKDCEKCGERVAWVGIWVNLALVILKLIVGFTSGSKACIADALHSAANIVTAFAIILSQKISGKPADSRFHYGYGKVEFLSAATISMLIIVGAVSLITISIKHLISEPSAPPHFTALLVAVISIGVNEMMFRFMRCAGTRLKSQTIMASAWSNRTDCFSSIAVIIGVIGGSLGFHHVDPIAAIFVVVIIIKVSIKIMTDSIKSLMDSSVNSIYSEEIESIVTDIEDVRAVAGLRTRHIGQKIWVELDILIDSQCTIREGHRIADRVKHMIRKKMRDVEKIGVYFKPIEGQG